MKLSRTMIQLANQPTEYEILRRLAFEISRHPDYLPNIRGRHERLAAKHTNAADAAREGEPTPPGTWASVSIKGSCRIARAALKAVGRDQSRKLRTGRAAPREIAEPIDATALQRMQAVRGSRLIA